MTLSYSTDIVIFGGGLAGLWLHKRLRLVGYHVILIETAQLGGGQTLASQGIIHGGLKYALGGNLTKAATTIANMPARWHRCLAGDDAMDLRRVKVLSEHYFMWSAPSLRSKIKTFLGSKSLQGRIVAVSREQRPAFFDPATGKGQLYQLPDFVIDSTSLITELVRDQEHSLFHTTADRINFIQAADQSIQGVAIRLADSSLMINCQKCIFSAGEGNADLMNRTGIEAIAMQRRPLHMVMLKHPALPPLYVHCISHDLSLTPILTITTHYDANGQTVWYLGGELAESGVGKTMDQQIAAARQQLLLFFPWLELDKANWSSFHIDRAEARMINRQRPDDAVFIEQNNAVVVFPTKFTLIPSLADKLLDQLRNSTLTKTELQAVCGLRQHLPLPPTGRTRWEHWPDQDRSCSNL